jgi:hypothetical protein
VGIHEHDLITQRPIAASEEPDHVDAHPPLSSGQRLQRIEAREQLEVIRATRGASRLPYRNSLEVAAVSFRLEMQ